MLGSKLGVDCLPCSENGWPCVGLLLGVGSQFTGLSIVLELSVTCSPALLTLSNGWGDDCCLITIPAVDKESAFQYS